MIKRLILACTALLLTTGMAMAQNAIPIVVVECENGKVNFLPQEATAGSYVDFGFESFLGYELDTLYINKVTGNVIEPIEWELFSWQVRFLMPECDRVEVTVKFKKKKYTVLIDDGIENGIVELDGENGIEFGTQVILKAIPDHDYLFNNLTVKNNANDTIVSTQILNVVDNTHYFAFTMPISDVTVNASFKPVPYYNIEITNGENGTITSDLESARVGDTVTLTVNNDTGCILKELKVVAGYPIEGGGEAHAPSVLKDNDMWYQQQVIVPTKIDNHTYQFVLPEQFDNIITPNYMSSTSFKITSSFKQVRPAVIWCENENSLFFIYEEDPVEDYVGLYGDYKISGMWIGSMVSETGWSRPAWTQDNAIKSNVQKVVFDEGFADLRPTSCYQWFSELFNLSDIEGIENLNTSEVTNMNSMFYSCFSLTTLNLNSFDVSKVTNATSMFRACSDLTTIFCDQTWNIDVASSMFQGASSLVGAVAYDNDNTSGNMANPVTGYFTGSQAITVDAQGNGVVNAPVKEFPTHTVSFTAKPAILCTLASLNVTGNNSGDTIETTLNNDVYSFVMPGEPVTISAVFTTPESEVPAVLWCEDNTTLYFVNVNYEAVSDSTWDGHTITQAWSGDIVNNTGWLSPGWISVNGKATRVVFDESFADLRPTSCYQWFSGLTSLSGIEGIENLNTSEVTNMNSMFYNCSSLTTLNLNSFDVSKVTNSSSMFRICGNLTTIYCDQTWNIETSIGMFQGSYKLVGAVAYDNLNTGGNMANPLTGYFTGSQAITVNAQGNGVVTAPVREYPRQTVSFTAIPATLCELLSLNVTGDISGNTIETTLSDGVYSFVMPGEPVTISAVFTTIPEGEIPAVLWSEDNTTLYFVNEPYEAMSDGTWDGHTITHAWIGDIVSNTAWSVPGWISVNDQATRVVFDESFADLRPTSCYQWFCRLTNLSDIEGIENLNTSEVTNMNSMFYNCSSLTTLNLNGFDVSKVTNSSSMFRICESLTTIYCDQTWNIGTSLGMFQAASNIVGAVAYDNDNTSGNMANPHTGYFTGKWSINISTNFEHGSVTCERDMAYTNETVTLTVSPDNGYELESLTVSTVDSGEPSGTSMMSLRGTSVDVTEGENHNYTFVMPAAPVIINASFATETIPEVTLAELCENGVMPQKYTISDDLIAVACAKDGNGNVYLWCKDAGLDDNDQCTSIKPSLLDPTNLPEGYEDYMTEHSDFNGDWDQSNWIALKFYNYSVRDESSDLYTTINGYVGKKIKGNTIKGTYDDPTNFLLSMPTTELTTIGAEPYTPNLYCPANFLSQNIDGDGAVGTIPNTDPEQKKHYFFMNPKVQEVCEITFAVWNGEYFVLPAPQGNINSTNIPGAFSVGWEFNDIYVEDPDGGVPHDLRDVLVPGVTYKFNAIVQVKGSKKAGAPSLKDDPVTVNPGEYDPDLNYTVYPINFDPRDPESIVTAINGVTVNGEVKRVKYINVAGMVSDRPFQGVNIVVTEYTDGSRTTSKMIR